MGHDGPRRGKPVWGWKNLRLLSRMKAIEDFKHEHVLQPRRGERSSAKWSQTARSRFPGNDRIFCWQGGMSGDKLPSTNQNRKEMQQ